MGFCKDTILAYPRGLRIVLEGSGLAAVCLSRCPPVLQKLQLQQCRVAVMVISVHFYLSLGTEQYLKIRHKVNSKPSW